MKHFTILWVVPLALGFLFDLLFWEHTPGLNFALYAVLCLAGGALVLLLNGVKPSWKALLLLIPVLFFAVMTFSRREPLSVFLAYVLTLLGMALLAQTWLGGHWWKFSLLDYAASLFRMLGGMVARPAMFLAERKQQMVAEGRLTERKAGWKRFWAVVRGLLIALPVVVIFAALLASADLVFARGLDDFLDLFRLRNLPEYLFRLFYILMGAWLLAGLFLHAAFKSQKGKLIGEDKPLVGRFLGFTEAAVVLGAVDLLFLLFVIVQVRYFFGGQTNIHLDGYTYSEYARRGFGELVAVAFISLLLFLSLSAVTRRESRAQRGVFSGLGIALVLLVGVMLVSAFQRLMLYEAAYGFSRLRMYTHVFMIWLGALLAVVAVLDILQKERVFALAALLASFGFAATLMLLNVDGFIVRQNVLRAPQGEGLDVPYLASLSPDAVPALVEAFEDESLPAATRDAVGAALVCMDATEYREPGEDNWRSFSLSRWNAYQALQPVQERLDGYEVDSEAYPVSVLTPLQTYYDCQQSYSD